MASTLQKERASSKDKRTADAVDNQRPKETPMEFISSMAVVLVTGLFIVTFNLQAFEIPSTSMKNTLLVGDHLFVDRTTAAPTTSWIKPLIPYSEIKHGDIIVFLSPAQPGLYIVKRIIGVPGDRIRLRNGVVYRNGQALDEPYVLHDADDLTQHYRNDFPSVTPTEGADLSADWSTDLASHSQGPELVRPPNSFFGMGDHRGVSMDSRYWGFIPRSHIIGRPMFIYWSFETPEGQYTKTSWGERVTFLAKIVIHFFDRTRWKRTLRVVR